MKKLVSVVLVLLLILCGCDAGYNRNSAGRSEHVDIVELVRTAVPHVGSMDLRLDYVDFVEEDAYGRRLFTYTLCEVSTRVWVVSQKTEEPQTYYYEDDCYVMRPRLDGEVPKEELDWLKANNDWDKPLDESKMCAINYMDDQEDVQSGSSILEVNEKLQTQ